MAGKCLGHLEPPPKGDKRKDMAGYGPWEETGRVGTKQDAAGPMINELR